MGMGVVPAPSNKPESPSGSTLSLLASCFYAAKVFVWHTSKFSAEFPLMFVQLPEPQVVMSAGILAG